MKEVVKINSEDSNLIERKFYEHAAGKDNVAFLMHDKDIAWEKLQHYIDVVESRFSDLEKTKERLSKKYEPKEFVGKSYNYSFDFNDESITYEMA